MLFLDEPTTGSDPSARRHAWDLVGRLRDLGTTIMLTTHYMDEAQYLADRAAVVQAGRLVAVGRPDELGGDLAKRYAIRCQLPGSVSTMELPPLIGAVRSENGTLTVSTMEPVADVNTLTNWALLKDVELSGLTLTRPTLEDIYLQLTGEAQDER